MFVFVGCRKRDESVIVVGISKIITHPALDAVERGIIDEVREQGFDNVVFDVQSANGEIATAASIANKFRHQNVRVAVGIATPMAQSLANNMRGTPIIFSAVTDPVGAGLRQSLYVEDTNITGVSDMTPVREQIELIARIVPLTRLGYIYNAGESNSVALLEIARQVCDDMGVELVVQTVTNTAEVRQAAEVIVPRVDAVYVGTDNVVAAAIASLTTVATRHGVPVIFADPTNKVNGVLASYGVNYYNLGRETGKIVVRVLNGEKPGDIPVKFMTKPEELEFHVNEEVARILGIELPENLF
jgi:putative ABC transport system substrate-binding protein